MTRIASQVPEEALSDRIETCPVCRDPDASRKPVVRLQIDPVVDLLECSSCSAQSADRMPNAGFLSALYDPAHYRSSLVSGAGLSERCARSIAREARFDPDRPLSIVDYGGSDGSLSRALRRELLVRGHRGDVRSTVVDLHPRGDSPHQRFIDPERFAKSGDRYDLLLASAVLEHLTHPAATIRSLLDHAAPASLFYARTPWDSPLQRVVPGYRVKWPNHLHDMGPAFWPRFMNVFGVSGEIVVSRPSIVETTFGDSPGRTLFAHLAKIPARLEGIVFPSRARDGARFWRLVGGWEVLIRIG